MAHHEMKQFRICWCQWAQFPDGEVHRGKPFLWTSEEMRQYIRQLNDDFPELCHWSEEVD